MRRIPLQVVVDAVEKLGGGNLRGQRGAGGRDLDIFLEEDCFPGVVTHSIWALGWMLASEKTRGRVSFSVVAVFDIVEWAGRFVAR